MASNATSAFSAIAFLKQHRQLPVLECSSASVAHKFSTAGAAWGKGSREWSRTVVHESDAAVVTGDEMPRELRTLVGASFDIFMRLNRLADERQRAQRELALAEVVKASREYREALKTCIFAIEDRVEQQTRSGTAIADSDDDEFVELLKVSLAIWHLCELLFMQRRPRDDKWLAYDLAQWLQEHFASAQLEQLETVSAALQRTAEPERDPAYWSTLHAFAMAGCGRSAWQLLAAHSNYRALAARDLAASSLTSASTRASFDAIQRLLLSMPGRSMSHSNSSERVEWTQWHDACQYVLSTDSLVKTTAGLSTLLQILVGDDDALARHATTWYGLMIARLVLDAPTRVAHRFEFLMATCVRTYSADAEAAMSNFDCIILALLQYDVASALQDVHALGFAWMAAHVSDLLVKSHAIEVVSTDSDDVSLCERLLLQYAIDMGASAGMWQLALGYYARCPRLGLDAARSVLAREPVETDAKAHRVLAFCHGKRGLVAIERLTAQRRAKQCEQQRAFGAAILWLLRAGLVDDVDAVCDAVLRECKATASHTPLHDAFASLAAHPELAQTPLLEWLVRYRELVLVRDDAKALCSHKQALERSRAPPTEQDDAATQLRFVQHEAATRVCWLVQSAAAPRELWGALLAEAEPLLAMQPTVFDAQHAYALLAFVQQLDRSFDRAGVDAQLKSRVEALLARNLSEAIVAEARAAASGSRLSSSSSSNVAAMPLLMDAVTAMDEA